jgi:predicted AAA+ superfamily ATPase
MLNELKAYPNLDCYVTGSNSKMLSSDIATEFRGRSSQIKVFPLSFEEFYAYRGGVASEALDEYMLYGGMPGLVNEPTPERKRAYLKNLYDEIYIKDLVEHAKIQREDVLESMLDYLASQIGSLTNASKITGALNTKLTTKITDDTVSKYLKHTMDAFLISEAKRYDVKGKKHFDYPNKYYYTDVGLRNTRLNYRQIEPGHMMENIIYDELIRRSYSVDVGVVEDRRGSEKKLKEIDFVVNYSDKKIYIQSALRMDEQEKADAELDSLRLTGDFFKKIVIRRDIPTSFYDEDGIFNCNLLDFLIKTLVFPAAHTCDFSRELAVRFFA